jgi:glc operon protein GlcG
MFQITTLGSADAQRALNAIQAELSRLNKSAAIAVLDAAGDPIALLRLDGTPGTCAINATRKAFTAVKESKPSRDIGRAVRNPNTGFDIAYFPDPRYIGWGGGLPVLVHGKSVGAVGVSGLSEDEDIHLAELGIKAILEPPSAS